MQSQNLNENNYNDETICNIDDYIDKLDYFKPRFYITGNIKMNSFNVSEKEFKIRFLRAQCKVKSREIFSIFEDRIGVDIPFTDKVNKYFDVDVVVQKQIISFKPTETKFNKDKCPEILPLQLLERDIISKFNKRLLGYMTTITLPVEFSFHDSWYLIEKIREVSLNIIKRYSLLSISTIEYMTKGNANYIIKNAKQVEWYKKLIMETDIDKQIKMLEPTGTKRNDFGFNELIGTKLPYLYYPSASSNMNNFTCLVRLFMIIRKRFAYIPDYGRKRIITKDLYRNQYDNQPNTTQEIYDKATGKTSRIPAYTPYFLGSLNTVSRKELLRSLFNYFNVILFNSKKQGLEGEYFDETMIQFCQVHYSRIRDTYNTTDEKSINKILDEYFPIHTIQEIGILKGVFEIDKDKLKIKVSPEEYQSFLRAENYYTYSENFSIEFTIFSFLAFQHIQNGLSNVGYPHIHIYFLTEALDRGPLNDIRREIDLDIKMITGLYGDKSVLTELKNNESYISGIGYIMKNHSSSFVDKMLTQVDQYGNQLRNPKDPVLYVDYYDQDLYELTSYVWLMMLGNHDNKDKISPWSFTNDYIPLKLRKNKNTYEIYKLIIQEFYPERVHEFETLEELRDIENDIFNIKYTPTDYKSDKIQWIHFLQRYMVDRKLVICKGHIYQKRKDAKYSFEPYYPKNDKGDISTIQGWESSITQFIESFSTYQSPRAPSEQLQKELIKILENTTPGYTSGRYHFPCIDINFRLVEYDDFILDIINRCIYDHQPKGQYCYLKITGINKSNLYQKIDEMLSTVSISMEEFINDKERRNILGLLKHLQMYDFHTLSVMYKFISVRFKKDELQFLIGDKNAYKSALTLFPSCVFPSIKIGLTTNFSSFDVGYNVADKLVVINEEAGPCMESFNTNDRPLLLNFAAGSAIVGEKKFKDHKKLSTSNISAIFAANINEDSLKYMTVPEIVARLNIVLHTPIKTDLCVVTCSEYMSILGQLLVFSCMISLSNEFYNNERIPKLHNYVNIPEPLERIHKYFNNNCNPMFLRKEGEEDRSALDIRNMTYFSAFTNDFYQTDGKLIPSTFYKTKEEVVEIIIEKAMEDKSNKLFESTKIRLEAAYKSNKLLEKQREDKRIKGIPYESF